MASIFDAYAQAYSKSLNQEAKLADALRVANLQRQQQELQQAQEARQAQRFNFELQKLQAETPNAVAEQRIRGLLLNNPEYANAFTSGNLARAQAGSVEAQAQYQGLLGLGPSLSRAYQAPYLKGANAADELDIMSALRGTDPARVTALTGVANPVRGSDMLWRSPDGRILQPNPLASLQVNAAADRVNPQQPRPATVNDVASMAGRQAVRRIDNAIDARQPVQPITPITPAMPIPAVTAQPQFPTLPMGGTQTIGIPSPMFSSPMVGQPGQRPTPIAGEAFPAFRDRLMQWDAMQKMYDEQQAAAQSEAERMRLLGERPDLSRLTLSRRAFENPFTLFNQ